MADYRIVCVNKSDVTDPRHSHIVEVGTGIEPTHYQSKWARETVVSAIDTGTHTFHTIGASSGERAEVYTEKCAHCPTRIIRSGHDAVADNNLGNLSPCE
jgi:hypothetical protein